MITETADNTRLKHTLDSTAASAVLLDMLLYKAVDVDITTGMLQGVQNVGVAGATGFVETAEKQESNSCLGLPIKLRDQKGFKFSMGHKISRAVSKREFEISQISCFSTSRPRFEIHSDNNGEQIFSQNFCLPSLEIGCHCVSCDLKCCIRPMQVEPVYGDCKHEARGYDSCTCVFAIKLHYIELILICVSKCSVATVVLPSEASVYGCGQWLRFHRLVYDRGRKA